MTARRRAGTTHHHRAHDAAYGAVLDRHRALTGDALARRARRVAAILRYAADGPAWTAGRAPASTGAIRGTLD